MNLAQVAACQALSGTGALSLAGSFLHQTLPPGTPVYITEPTWSNHRQVFEAAGFQVREFRWYSAETGRLDLASVLDALSQAPPRSVFVFHASAHNPSGCDPSKEEWKQIADVVKERRVLPLFDSAYLGITSGSYADDAFAIRYFVDELGLETVVCASFAKNMGLYGKLTVFSWERMTEPAIPMTIIDPMGTDWCDAICRRACRSCITRHQVRKLGQGSRVEAGSDNSSSHLQPASIRCTNSGGHSWR